MKTLTLIALPLLLALSPSPAIAQDSQAARPVVQAATAIATVLAAAPDLVPVTVDPDQVRPVAPPPPPPKPPRRRGSMVGYIEDPLVSTKVRLRFDIGMHIDTPDRAEFFYAKCGCYRDLPPSNAAYDPNAPGPGPGAATDLNFQEFYVQAEYVVKPRLSVLGELPIRWLQPQAFNAATIGPAGGFTSQAGLSDLKVGAKYEVYSTDQTVATVRAQFFLPSGNSADGLGTNNVSFEPAFLIYQGTSNRAINVEGEVALRLPFGGSKPVPTSADGRFAGNVLSYGIGPSFEVYRSGRYSFAPVIELAAWHVFSGFQTASVADASGTNIVNLKFGGRLSIDDRASIYVGYGHALTDAKWYSDIVRLEYRYMF
jgi:hypothetical protein